MLKRLLITGAAGGLGQVARQRLSHVAEVLRPSDIAELDPAGPNEECAQCDLGDADAVMDLVAGCDGILHLGGRSVEDKFSVIANANIHGVFHIYEAARKTGCSRILFASSNHVIGMHTQDQRLDHTALPKPDTRRPGMRRKRCTRAAASPSSRSTRSNRRALPPWVGAVSWRWQEARPGQ